MNYLIFQLYGPMSSWGDIAIGEVRPSLSHPTHSAIIGLLAAALGIKRSEEERQQRFASSFQIAVCVENAGMPLRDYHTIQVPTERRGTRQFTRKEELASDDLNTILSTREYRTDASYTVIVSQADEQRECSLEALKDALLKPKFLLFLGRKASPLALPLYPQIVEAESCEAALMLWDNAHSLQKKQPLLNKLLSSGDALRQLYWSDETENLPGAIHSRTVRDLPSSRKRWQFTNRKVNYKTIEKGELNVLKQDQAEG